MPDPFFSIIIPTRNEAMDILKTLRSIAANSWKEFEVLVVDASEDATPRVVQEFGDSRFQLVPQNNRDGRCGARNQGIRMARGEVVVILNADVFLPVDFLERIYRHYGEGADYVIVDSKVENWRHPYGAMVEAEHRLLYRSGREAMNWCEGYSCRRKCALEVGLFPENFPVAICAGEDAVFGERMAARFHRVEDFSIVVTHQVPEELPVFWDQRIGRGRGCAQRLLLLDGWSPTRFVRDGIYWTIKGVLWVGLIFPMVRYASKLKKIIPDVSLKGYIKALFLTRVSHEIGRWKGYAQCRSAKIPTNR